MEVQICNFDKNQVPKICFHYSLEGTEIVQLNASLYILFEHYYVL